MVLTIEGVEYLLTPKPVVQRPIVNFAETGEACAKIVRANPGIDGPTAVAIWRAQVA
jgi:hypothetical protein